MDTAYALCYMLFALIILLSLWLSSMRDVVDDLSDRVDEIADRQRELDGYLGGNVDRETGR